MGVCVGIGRRGVLFGVRRAGPSLCVYRGVATVAIAGVLVAFVLYWTSGGVSVCCRLPAHLPHCRRGRLNPDRWFGPRRWVPSGACRF